ncbi:hypothetical protein L3V16_21015 [Brucella ciceri]|uniref:hypothetical protein n=1 Tax=Brucella ciceri TaxID=391287 RepID=UPI001F140FBD|nr:hypothetical protein [Brucella ciceri]MCH6206308.1 hypothetical protein [Brucella ciceri]
MVVPHEKTVNTNSLDISRLNFVDHETSHNVPVTTSSRPHFSFEKKSNSPRFVGVNQTRTSPATFMKRFQEDILRANMAKAKKQARRKNSDVEITPEAEYFIEQARINRELIKERLEQGYDRRGWKTLSGHQVAPVQEKGLRSQTLNSAAAKLFVAAVPKAKDLRTNWGKGALTRIGIKLFSLDEPYIEGNRKFLSFVRIDTDRVWNSYEQCQEFFRQLAHDGKIACEPHFLVGLRLPNGQFVRPHAIWMLPYGSAVWNEPSKAGFNRAPVDLFHSVYYGLCNALLEAGADAGAPATSQQVKNPLSPEWFTVCPQDSHFPDLSEHADYLELGHNRESLTRRSAAVQSGMDIQQSNGLFNFLQKAAYSIMSGWHFAADPEFARNRAEGRLGAISDRLHIELERAVAQSDIRPGKRDGNIQYLIASVANYAVGKWNPEKLNYKRDRGAALHLVQGMTSMSDRMAAGGKYAALKNSERVVNAIKTTIQKLKAQGVELTKATVARFSGISRPTVHKYWDQVMAVARRAQGCKKQGMIKRYSQITGIAQNENHAPRPASMEMKVDSHALQAVKDLQKSESDIHIEVNSTTGQARSLNADIGNPDLLVVNTSERIGISPSRPRKRVFAKVMDWANPSGVENGTQSTLSNRPGCTPNCEKGTTLSAEAA